MKLKHLLPALTVVMAFVFTQSCAQTVNNPSPSLKSISPASATAGSPGFVMTLTGGGFAPQSTVTFNGLPRNTIFLGGSQLTTMVLPSDIANPGTIKVGVSTAAPGGGTSGTVDFTINANNSQLPQITSISPNTAIAGSGQTTVLVTGTGFNSQSVVTVDNNNRSTSLVNGTELAGLLTSADLSTAGTFQIGVLNPPPGGGASNTLTFTVANATPTINSVLPSTTNAGGTNSVTISVLGSGFSIASVVIFNGTPQTTTVIANNQATITLDATAIANAGTVSVQVSNPPPGGGVSNSVAFTILPGTSGTGLPELADVAYNGLAANFGIGDKTSSGPAISSTGQYMAFGAIATNLVANDSNGVADIFVYNSCIGTTGTCVPGTTRASVDSGGNQANGASSQPAIDSSGRYVAFSSTATNLAGGIFLDGTQEVFWRDTCAGVTGTCVTSTILASVANDGLTPANGNSFQPSLSPDGRYVAFSSVATNLASGNAAGLQQIYVYDTCAGATSCTPSTQMISIGADGVTPGDGSSSQPAISNTALYVAFTSSATNLGPANAAGAQEIFERTTCIGLTGCTAVTSLASTPDGTTAADGSSMTPTISSDGRFIGFASTATTLGGGTDGTQQIYERDTCTGASGCTTETLLVSVATDEVTPGNGTSESPSMDSTGLYVAFASNATNLVATDTNGFEDVFVRSTCAGASGCTPSTANVSVTGLASTAPGTQGNGASVSPAMSGNNKFCIFLSDASNLVPVDTNGATDAFLANTTF